jgi:hypothetical protein
MKTVKRKATKIITRTVTETVTNEETGEEEELEKEVEEEVETEVYIRHIRLSLLTCLLVKSSAMAQV